MAYSEKVIDHYENPRNVGKLDAEDDRVGTGMVGAPACGDVMRLQTGTPSTIFQRCISTVREITACPALSMSASLLSRASRSSCR